MYGAVLGIACRHRQTMGLAILEVLDQTAEHAPHFLFHGIYR